MRLPLNLATRPFINYRAFLLAGSTLLLLSVGLTTALAVHGSRLWKESTTMQARLADLQKERQAFIAEQNRLEESLQGAATRQLLERARFLNQLILEKHFSWTQLFLDLQQNLPDDVRVLQVSPQMKDDGTVVVDLRLGSESTAALIQYLRALEAGDRFHDVQLHSQTHSSGENRDALEAEVSLGYSGEAAR